MRYLIKTTMALQELSRALAPNATVAEAGPAVRLAAGYFLDVDVTPSVPNSATADLPALLGGIDGIDEVIPVPDAEPGSP